MVYYQAIGIWDGFTEPIESPRKTEEEAKKDIEDFMASVKAGACYPPEATFIDTFDKL